MRSNPYAPPETSMDAPRVLYLLGACTVGEVLLTLAYAVQLLLGSGTWFVLGLLALVAVGLTVLSLAAWERAKVRQYIYRESCEPSELAR